MEPKCPVKSTQLTPALFQRQTFESAAPDTIRPSGQWDTVVTHSVWPQRCENSSRSFWPARMFTSFNPWSALPSTAFSPSTDMQSTFRSETSTTRPLLQWLTTSWPCFTLVHSLTGTMAFLGPSLQRPSAAPAADLLTTKEPHSDNAPATPTSPPADLRGRPAMPPELTGRLPPRLPERLLAVRDDGLPLEFPVAGGASGGPGLTASTAPPIGA
mmetsp:Transcript_63263/g.176012  ORF Transcript_63263/g.176012 Transcript_63263/m.176012 type:complete len:214 (+) Transcript_63263:785-1426(+)